jgi:hypothetical protein
MPKYGRSLARKVLPLAAGRAYAGWPASSRALLALRQFLAVALTPSSFSIRAACLERPIPSDR